MRLELHQRSRPGFAEAVDCDWTLSPAHVGTSSDAGNVSRRASRKNVPDGSVHCRERSMEDASETGMYSGRAIFHVDQLCSVSDDGFGMLPLWMFGISKVFENGKWERHRLFTHFYSNVPTRTPKRAFSRYGCDTDFILSRRTCHCPAHARSVSSSATRRH